MDSEIDIAEADLDSIGGGARVGVDESVLIDLSLLNKLGSFGSALIVFSPPNKLVDDVPIWLNGDDVAVCPNVPSAPLPNALPSSVLVVSSTFTTGASAFTVIGTGSVLTGALNPDDPLAKAANPPEPPNALPVGIEDDGEEPNVDGFPKADCPKAD